MSPLSETHHSNSFDNGQTIGKATFSSNNSNGCNIRKEGKRGGGKLNRAQTAWSNGGKLLP